LWKAAISMSSVCLSVSLHGTTWLPLDGFSWNFILHYFLISLKIQVSLNLTWITGTLHEDVWTFVIKSCWILPIMRNISDKVVENIKTHILCSVTLFQKCHLWDNVEKCCTARQTTDDNIIWSMSCACWITKATKTYSDYVIRNDFPWEQWLHEHASMLHYTYLTCLLVFVITNVQLVIQVCNGV
jgi:hypothetical protein